jgi:hypothetical protein
VVIRGGIGAGKSTLLVALGAEAVQRGRIPVYVRWDGEDPGRYAVGSGRGVDSLSRLINHSYGLEITRLGLKSPTQTNDRSRPFDGRPVTVLVDEFSGASPSEAKFLATLVANGNVELAAVVHDDGLLGESCGSAGLSEMLGNREYRPKPMKLGDLTQLFSTLATRHGISVTPDAVGELHRTCKTPYEVMRLASEAGAEAEKTPGDCIEKRHIDIALSRRARTASYNSDTYL